MPDPNIHLYTLNESQTAKYIQKILHKRKIPYHSFLGNIFSYRFPDRPLFVGHMDTVKDEDMSRKLLRSPDRLSRIKGILGADDKAGLDILINNIANINFVFTVGEEYGGLGAHDLLTNEEFVGILEKAPFAVEYDRRGSSDIIEYCTEELTDYIMDKTMDYYPAEGVFTDISVWQHLIPGVNLSVGYYQPHTSFEYLNLKEWSKAFNTLKLLNVESKRFPVRKKLLTSWHSFDDDDEYPDNFFNSNVVCAKCGQITDPMFTDSRCEPICTDCMEYIYNLYKM